MAEEWDVPLFDVPPSYRPPARAVKFPQWRAHTGRRVSCDVCMIALARGEVKFMAEPAMHVRTDADGRMYLCPKHAHDRRVEDER